MVLAGPQTITSQPKGKSHTSQGRHQSNVPVTTQARQPVVAPQQTNTVGEDLSSVVAMANKRERGHSAKPTTASHHREQRQVQQRGGSSSHSHTKAHQHFAQEAGLTQTGSLLHNSQQHVRAGSANLYHSRGKKNVSGSSNATVTVGSPIVSSSTKASTMIGNLSHMLNGVTQERPGVTGGRTTKNAGSFHYERLNKNHSTGRVSSSNAAVSTSAGFQNSSRHQYNTSVVIGPNSGLTSGQKSSKQHISRNQQASAVTHEAQMHHSIHDHCLHELAITQPSSVTHHALVNQPMYAPVPPNHQPNLQFANMMALASQTPQGATSFQMSTPQASQAPNKMPPSNSQHLLAINKHKKDLHDIMQQLTQQTNTHAHQVAQSNSLSQIASQPKQKTQAEYDYLKKLKKAEYGGKQDEKHQHYQNNQIQLLNHTQKSADNKGRMFSDIRNVLQYPEQKRNPSAGKQRTSQHVQGKTVQYEEHHRPMLQK